MQNLLQLLFRFSNVFIFLFFELICIYMVINYNHQQRNIFIQSASRISGGITNQVDKLTGFLSLDNNNEKLAVENAALKKALQTSQTGNRNWLNTDFQDSSYNFDFTPAKVIQNSIKRRNNYITINKGTADGIQEGMGVISRDGLVGIVKQTTNKFSSIISLLHSQTRISAKLQSSAFFGSIKWNFKNPRYVKLDAIPKHAQIKIGDTIVTSGFSNIFPENLVIGVIDDLSIPSGSNFYDIDVQLNNELDRLSYIYIIKNYNKVELDSLSNSSFDE